MKTTLTRISVPHRQDHDGIWLPQLHLKPGVHDVELPDEYEQAHGVPPGLMSDALKALEPMGVTVIARGAEAVAKLDAIVTPPPPPDPEKPPEPGQPGSPAKPLKSKGG